MSGMSQSELTAWVAHLRAGGVLACATETQMGLLADGLSEAAVQRVAQLKQRPDDAPIALLLPDVSALAQVSSGVRPEVLALAGQHWPGPLTLVVPALPGLPRGLCREGTVGVRVPGPSPALSLVRAFGGPLTATSANLSGQATARDTAEAQAIFGDGLAGVIPGSCPGGAPSTIVDATGPRLRVLRAGALSIPMD